MNIRGAHRIKCDREQIWARLIDFNYLGRVIPGGKRFSQSGRSKYKGTLSVRVSFVKVKLNATLTREKTKRPCSFRLRVYARGGGAKVSGKVDFKLNRMGECETELSYKGDLDFQGVPGFVIGKVQKRLKKAIRDLSIKIEKDCKRSYKSSPTDYADESLAEVIRVDSQFEQELGAIISKAQSQFEAELSELISKSGSQLKVELTELISRIEKQRQQEGRDAH